MKKRTLFLLLALCLVFQLPACRKVPNHENLPSPSCDVAVSATASPEESPAAPVVSNTPGSEPMASLTPEPNLLPIVSVPVAAGSKDYYVIRNDGTLIMWGTPDYGYLSNIPAHDPVILLENAASVSAGPSGVVMAIDKNGTLWGLNMPEYYIAINPAADINSPEKPVRLMEGVSMVSCGQFHSLILKQDGTLWTYCVNNYGIPSEEHTITAEQRLVKIMDDVIFTSVSGFGGYAILEDYSLWEWGITSADLEKVADNIACVHTGEAVTTTGELIQWSYDFENDARGSMETILTAVAVCNKSIAIRTDGSLWTWGYNSHGELGDGTTANRRTPIKVLSDVTYAAMGEFCTVILRTDGSIWMTGDENSAIPDQNLLKPYLVIN